MKADWLFMTGMMGAGKTSVGSRIAQSLGWRFVDLDQVIEDDVGRSISAIFAASGEVGFRAVERDLLKRLLTEAQDGHSGTVLALGGGTFVQDGAADVLRPHGPTVLLNVAPEELAQRLSEPEEAAHRPLLEDAQTLSKLWASRQERYLKADHVIDAGGESLEAVGVRCLQALGEKETLKGFTSLNVELGDRSYPIWIGDGGVKEAASMVRLHLEALSQSPSRIFVVTDARVAPLYLGDFTETLDAGPWSITAVVVPEGEPSKSQGTLDDVLTQFLAARPGRQDVVVALGGGVVGDLAGFASAILLRGVRYVQVPTTVLAQVDSSVGGKTGINHPSGKNLIGAFHQPIAVVMALGMLGTLDRRQVSSGLAEVVKYAVLDGEDLLGQLEADAEQLVTHPEKFPALIATCCRVKAHVVAADEKESRGIRALLNLGHTFGHAIEAMEGYQGVTHGEAVALGTLLAARAGTVLLAEDDGRSQGMEARLAKLLTRLQLPTDSEVYVRQHQTMAGYMAQDKKVQGSSVTLILPASPGDVRLHPVSTESLPDLLEQLAQESYGG